MSPRHQHVKKGIFRRGDHRKAFCKPVDDLLEAHQVRVRLFESDKVTKPRDAFDRVQVELGPARLRVVVEDERTSDLGVEPGEKVDALLLFELIVIRGLYKDSVSSDLCGFPAQAQDLSRVSCAAPSHQHSTNGHGARSRRDCQPAFVIAHRACFADGSVDHQHLDVSLPQPVGVRRYAAVVDCLLGTFKRRDGGTENSAQTRS